MQTCGTCQYARAIPKDLKKKQCYGNPPGIIPLPGPGGGIVFQMVRPMVEVGEHACGLWRQRSAIEADATQEPQQIAPEIMEKLQAMRSAANGGDAK